MSKRIRYERRYNTPLQEGTWALPDSLEKVIQLRKLLSKPLAAKDAEKALQGALGDDDLYDQIQDTLKSVGPNTDVRQLVLDRMKLFIQQFKQNPEDFNVSIIPGVFAQWRALAQMRV